MSGLTAVKSNCRQFPALTCKPLSAHSPVDAIHQSHMIQSTYNNVTIMKTLHTITV